MTIANEKLNNAGTGGGRAFMNAENTNTDWQDVVFLDPAISKVHNLSIDGGNDRTTYFLSLNYTDQEGLIKTNFVERYGIRANLEQKINKLIAAKFGKQKEQKGHKHDKKKDGHKKKATETTPLMRGGYH